MKNVIIATLIVLSLGFLILAFYQKIEAETALLLASKQQAQLVQLQKAANEISKL